MTKILVYPKDVNPYQKFLYSNFSSDFQIEYLLNPFSSHILSLFFLPISLMKFRLKGFKVFHLHWLFTFQFDQDGPVYRNSLTRFGFFVFFVFFFLFLKYLGYKLVWTVHDVLPHKKIFFNDHLASKFLSRIADLLIVHSTFAMNQMKSLGYKTEKVHVIPIGSYDFYLNTVSKTDARKKLRINQSSFVYSFFGRLEKYKGIFELVNSFNELDISDAVLLIAGTTTDQEVKTFLEKAAKSNKKIFLFNAFIPDEEVQYYVNAPDIFVYPFIRVTTSSSILLNMSFGVPAIANLVGDINEIPKDAGLFRNLDDKKTIHSLMKAAYENRKKVHNMGQKSLEFISGRSWDKTAKMTETEIEKILI